MDVSDPFRNVNPWALTRYLKNSCSACPMCRNVCGFDINFDQEEETVRVVSRCGKCGKTELFPYIKDNGDLEIVFRDTGKVYEPDRNCYALWNSSDVPEAENSDRETLGKLSETAKIYGRTKRAFLSAELGKSVAAEYGKHIGTEGWEDAENECLAQVTETAETMVGAGRNADALGLYGEYLYLAENNQSGKAYAFVLARAFSLFSEGNLKESAASVRQTVAALDRMKAENRIPADDPYIRSRAYEALGMLLSAKNDRTGSMKAVKKALEDALEVLKKNVDDGGLRWMNRCSREYAFACSRADMKKRGMAALKDAVKFCSAHRDTFPHAYAESLLEKGMFVSGTGDNLPAGFREDMDEVISILGKPDANGKYDPLLPVAYYYRSMTGADKEKLDDRDLETAYNIIRDGVKTGEVPDSVLASVMETYATYLDVYDAEKSAKVRKELAEMGIWVHPPVGTKP